MALDVETGTFTKTTSTSTPVSQQVNLSNGSLTPKIIIIWGSGQTTQNRTYEDDARFSYGFSDTTNDACQAYRADESAENETYIFRNNAIISILDLTTNTEVSVADVSSVAAGSFTLNWSTQSNTEALIYHYKVIGGSDITNASVVSTTIGSTTTGNKSFTGSGTTFTPEWGLCMSAADGTTVNTLSTLADRGMISIGAFKSTTERWVVSGRDETVTTSDCDMYINDSAILNHHDIANGAITFLADFVSFDNATGGGITINVSDGAGATTNGLAFLLVKGGLFGCGVFQQRSGTGTQDVFYNDPHLDTSIVSLYGINSATKGSLVANMYLAFGAATASAESCTYTGNTNGLGTWAAVRTNTNTKCYMQATPNATASSSTTNAEADMNDLTVNGKFQLNWTTASGTLHQIGYWALGVSGPGQFNRSPSADTVNISESLGRYKTPGASTPANCKTGTITKDTTTGAHTQNFTDELGFAPTAMMFFVTHRTSAGTGAHLQHGIGMTDGLNHFSISTSQEDNTLNADGASRSSSTACIHLINQTSNAILFDASATLGSNGFDLVYASADAVQYKIGYIAWGGKVANAKVSINLNAGTGSRTYSDVGFEGDVAIFLGNTCAANGTTSEPIMAIGVADGTNQWSVYADTNTGFPTDASKGQVTDKCMRTHVSGGAGSFTTDAAFTAFTSNGYTLNYTSAGTADVFGALVMDGAWWDIGSFNQATSNGNQQVDITTGRTPKGVLFSSFGNTSTSSIVAGWTFSVGASDNSSNISSWTGAQDNLNSVNRTNDSDYSDTKCLRLITPGSTPTLQTETQMNSFASGSFTLNNTTTDATARQIVYLSYGSESTGTTFNRSPTAEDVTISDASLTRILSAVRVPSTENPAISEDLTRTLSASRAPSSDSTTITDSSLTRVLTSVRSPSSDNVTVEDSSTTQMITRIRAPDAENVSLGENTSRMTQAFRSPSSDTVVIDESLSGGKLLERTPSAENVTVADSSLTRLLSASRSPSADDITVGENLTRILSAMRSPSSDSVIISDVSTTQMITRVRSVEDIVSVTDTSLTRLLSATRSPSSDSVTVTDSSLTRIYSALRVPSTDTVVIDESVDRVHTTAGQFNRAPNPETVDISENLSRMLQAFRAPSSDTIDINENVSGGKLLERVVAADTVNIVEASLNRVLSVSRNVEDTSNVNEASLTRLLTALRAPSPDSVTVSELQNRISHSRVLQDTVSITEPLLERIVTHIRNLGPEFVEVSEQVFFQTWHRYVFDSVIVADQVFAQRESLSGPTTYATPSEVRPLLGNIGSQRLDSQIQLAIDSAYDEINKKTSRIPPNDWKDTDADFSIIKKLTRMKAALEMSIGIKDFEDREWMQKEIEEMFMMLEEHDIGGAQSNDFVMSSEDETYSLNPTGLIWSQRYKNLRKQSTDENNTTINPDT